MGKPEKERQKEKTGRQADGRRRKEARKKPRDQYPSVKVDAKILNKTPSIIKQLYIQINSHHDQMEFIPGMQNWFNI